MVRVNFSTLYTCMDHPPVLQKRLMLLLSTILTSGQVKNSENNESGYQAQDSSHFNLVRWPWYLQNSKLPEDVSIIIINFFIS